MTCCFVDVFYGPFYERTTAAAINAFVQLCITLVWVFQLTLLSVNCFTLSPSFYLFIQLQVIQIIISYYVTEQNRTEHNITTHYD